MSGTLTGAQTARAHAQVETDERRARIAWSTAAAVACGSSGDRR